MIEQRCENPHPTLQGRMCNAKLVAIEGTGVATMACPRCRGPVKFTFTEGHTASGAQYIPIS